MSHDDKNSVHALDLMQDAREEARRLIEDGFGIAGSKIIEAIKAAEPFVVSAIESPRWIPVAERKPGINDGRVLILIADKSVAIEEFITGGHVDGHGRWWAGVPGDWILLLEKRWEVTHWMPSPSAPSDGSAAT